MAIIKMLHQLVIILLVFSQLLFSLNAASTSRANELFHGGQHVPSSSFENTYLQRMRKLGNGRKDIEVNDYSESGPNKSHTPEPPAASGN
ncbi:conserved hypothetical protein [Ricinus communis]|uniref:Uncharacterized protein n=1 Tax=Ricinus communis TaxID=3988 RepID=B9S8Y1_RICCO|nr:conserved hypothetical protein [Ricinus communis]